MDVQCPHCHFSREVEASALPPLPCKVTCPQCNQSFTLEVPPVEPEQVDGTAEVPPPVPPPLQVNNFVEEPAGFWVRALAATIDSMLCNIIVFAMGFSVGMLLNIGDDYIDPSIQLLLMLMGILVTLFYYVFFTGYCGQTPGKMALRIKVVHRDDGDISYGQAFVRETVGKTISYLIFCIGYLMVAFRSDKRGLHDLIAATKVIKL
ncbi:MAG: hypothetical protein B6I36_05905 [Desulfobacteraceae bacterium 4572_35.1]|nr:MAG: hypothetical protein B6I36_05905 [Desulfobacteraceae bacterium 4572_35.1]